MDEDDKVKEGGIEEEFSNDISLRSQTSCASMDSGIISRNLSSSSFGHPDPPENSSSLELIVEKRERPLSPVVIIEEPTTGSVELTRKLHCSELSHHLNIPTGSTDSSASEKLETPPTSPEDTISRRISVASSASSSPIPQEVRITVQVDLPASNEVVTVNTSAMVNKNLRQLHLNFSFTPTPSTSSPIQRCDSSPSFTPNVPKDRKKLKTPSKSFDEKSPPHARQRKPMLPSKSLDDPSSPCTVLNTTRNSRRFRNNLIASIVRRNMVEFVDSTDIDSLSAHLFAKELLSHKDLEELVGIKSVRGKNNFLYMLLLASKGVDAYQKLFECLKEETQHCGHMDLVKIIDQGLKHHTDQEYL